MLPWIGIAFSISQSAMFSGLNLALFGVSWLRLEVLATTGNDDARHLLALRKDSNFLLTTILWGNVAANVLLTILSDSILAGATAFVFSTFVITLGGEILPQAYFSRHALAVAGKLWPVLRFYQFLLYPLAKPTAKMLDAWLGQGGIEYFREKELQEVIRRHVASTDSDVDKVEGLGALNFLSLDDLPVSEEGEPVSPASIITLPESHGRPLFPSFRRDADDAFLKRMEASEHHWVIITSDRDNEPLLAVDSDAFLRAALFGREPFNPYVYCHRPIVIRDPTVPLGEVIPRLYVSAEDAEDDVVDHDVILLWGDTPRVITGADILGRLLRGITDRRSM
jgi:metal transporter CNNM